ncbi:hypothetical protein MMC28_003097 [Mycoblastus sanguinarius]|nr:hypothetical protein [Mycoblastus sanguinarius]
MKLVDYITPISSSSFHWITYLTLSYITCSRTDLVQISRLPNLGVLTIAENVKAPDIGLEDSILRTWGRIAATSSAFSMLRVLNCRSQRELTSRSFDHLNQFPVLALFNVEDCNIGPWEKPVALQYGWKYRTGKDLSDWFAKGGAIGSGWDSIVHASFRMGGTFSAETLTVEGVDAVDSLPVLHLCLGAIPREAVVDKKGDKSMRSFYRVAPNFELHHPSKKRFLNEGQPYSANSSRKKPTIRSSKRQNMEDMLIGLNS